MTVHEFRDENGLRLECWRDETLQATLNLRFLEPRLWQVQKLELPEDATKCLQDWLEALHRLGQAEQPQILSNDRNTEVNALLEQAGWRLGRQKAFVERSLLTPLPETSQAIHLTSLDELGQAEFVRVLLSASQGDPFETSTPESAESDFLELVEYAGDAFDASHWFIALQDGQLAGVLMPQTYPDEPETGTLFYLGVCPEFREQGLGRALHAAGLEQLQQRGATKYVGSTDLRNTGMRRIFAMNGCTEIRQQWFYEWVTP